MSYIRRLVLLGTSLLALMAMAGSPASAATWTPPGTAFTGTAGTSSEIKFLPIGSVAHRCNSTLSGTTANPASANATVTGPAGVTFTSCIGSFGIGWTIATAGTWTLHANSPTSVTVSVPNGGATITEQSLLGNCTRTVNASQITGTWNNVQRTLTLWNQLLNATSSALPCSPAPNSGIYVFGTFQFSPGTIRIS